MATVREPYVRWTVRAVGEHRARGKRCVVSLPHRPGRSNVTNGVEMEHSRDCETCAVHQDVRVILQSSRPPHEKIREVELTLQAKLAGQPRLAGQAYPLGRTRDWPILGTPWQRHEDQEVHR